MERIQELGIQKKSIEDEIEALLQFLNQSGMPGLHGPLIDEEGFPRSDVDVYGVREARHRLACLKTDYKNTMEEIEKGLHQLHAISRKSGISRPNPKSSTSLLQSSQSTAFALIDEVFPGSPAESAGLKVGDALIQFGGISVDGRSASDCFAQLPNVITNDRLPLSVRVLRDGEFIDLALQPRAWAGRGLLGCHMKPTV